MSVPKAGETMTCRVCKRDRVVVGVAGGWATAHVECRDCNWRFANERYGKKRLVALAERHADANRHVVFVVHDGYLQKIKPTESNQPFLIDDLLMP